jgi:hypothetical protein
MVNRLIRSGLICLALVAQTFLAYAGQQSRSTMPVQPSVVMNWPNALAVMAAPDSEPADVDRQFDEPESHAQHAARINRNLMTATVIILALFVLCRIVLLWQISRARKKQARENLLETKA